MRSLIQLIVLSGLVLVIGAGSAHAQNPPPGPGGVPNTGPAVSPYLNLLRRGNSAGANYYGLVKPELEFRNAYRGLQGQLSNQLVTQNVDPRTGLPETGHPTMFLNTGGYFMSAGRGQAGGTGLAQRPQGPPQGQQTQATPARGGAGRPATPH